jgi:hypothetical protein
MNGMRRLLMKHYLINSTSSLRISLLEDQINNQ